jgi:hypothetical protein
VVKGLCAVKSDTPFWRGSYTNIPYPLVYSLLGNKDHINSLKRIKKSILLFVYILPLLVLKYK